MRVAGSLTHLFHAQADAASLQIHLDDFDGHHVADADDLEGVFHITVGQLADMHQAVLLDADIHEGAEVNNIAQIIKLLRNV
jgi:hypothetical protein